MSRVGQVSRVLRVVEQAARPSGSIPLAEAAAGADGLAPAQEALRRTREAGRNLSALVALPRYPLYRELPGTTQRQVDATWTQANRVLSFFGRHPWRHHPEYLDPADPLSFDRWVARDAESHPTAASLHHLFRKMLAAGDGGDPLLPPDRWSRIVSLLQGLKSRDASAHLEALRRVNPPSVIYLTRLIEERALAAEGPAQAMAGSLRAAAHRVREWPEGASIEGPLLAFYWVNRGRPSEFRAFHNRLKNPRLKGVRFSEDGQVEFARERRLTRRERAEQLTTSLPAEISAADRRLLLQFVDEVLVLPHSSLLFRAFIGDLETIRDLNPASLSFLIQDLRRFFQGRITRTRFRISMRSAAGLVRRQGAGRVEGPALAYYLRHRGDPVAFSRLTMTLIRNPGAKVVFDQEGGFRSEYERPGRSGRPEGAAVGPYREATSFSQIPHPGNRWAEEDLTRPRASLGRRIAGFFARVERRLEKGSAGMIERWRFPNYYNHRAGQRPVPLVYLSDERLAAVGLNPFEVEELRHLQTALAVDFDRGQERIGPYGREGLLLRYWRLMGGKKISVVEAALGPRGSRTILSRLELGWLRTRDESLLTDLADRIDVPAVLRGPLARHLLERYDEADRATVSFRPRGRADRFPDPEWDIPHYGLPREEVVREIQSRARAARGNRSRTAFGRVAGLTEGQIDLVEWKGEVSLPIIHGIIRYLKKRRRFEEAGRLVDLSAVAALQTFPASEDAALADVGRLLRYVRYRIPIVSADEMGRRLGFRGDHDRKTLYHAAEQGVAALGVDTLRAFAAVVEGRGVWDNRAASDFVRHIRALYKARGIRP